MASLEPRLHSERYTFDETNDAGLDEAFALIREDEGLTIIRQHPKGEWARISLQVHSSLDAVGLTAALSAALAEAGMSANVVAALRHDHLFVPWERRDEAMTCLRSLAR